MHVILINNESNTLILTFLALYLALEFSFNFRNVDLVLYIYIPLLKDIFQKKYFHNINLNLPLKYTTKKIAKVFIVSQGIKIYLLVRLQAALPNLMKYFVH